MPKRNIRPLHSYLLSILWIALSQICPIEAWAQNRCNSIFEAENLKSAKPTQKIFSKPVRIKFQCLYGEGTSTFAKEISQQDFLSSGISGVQIEVGASFTTQNKNFEIPKPEEILSRISGYDYVIILVDKKTSDIYRQTALSFAAPTQIFNISEILSPGMGFNNLNLVTKFIIEDQNLLGNPLIDLNPVKN